MAVVGFYPSSFSLSSCDGPKKKVWNAYFDSKDDAEDIAEVLEGIQGRTSFEEAVHEIMHVVDEVVDEALCDVSDRVLDDVVKHLKSPMPYSKNLIRTSIICCAFDDIDTMTSEIGIRLCGKVGASKAVRVQSDQSSPASIADRLAQNCSGDDSIALLIVSNSESLPAEWLERLFRLVLFRNTPLAIVICSYGNVSSFYGKCSARVCDQLAPKIFSFQSSKKFDKIMDSFVRGRLSLYPDGKLLTVLRANFFGVDHSVVAMKTRLKAAMLDHLMENPTWVIQETDAFEERRKEYLTTLTWLLIEWDHPEWFHSVHEAIQMEQPFWKESETTPHDYKQHFETYRQWMSNLARLDLPEWSQLVQSICQVVRPTMAEQISKCLVAYEKASAIAKTDTKGKPEPGTPKTQQKMTAMELQRMLKEKREQAQREKPLHVAALQKLQNTVSCVLREVLIPWKDLPNGKWLVVTSRQAECWNPGTDMETALTRRQVDGDELSNVEVAYKALLGRSSWKWASIDEWGAEYEQKMPSYLKKYPVDSFRAAMGQLENMGIVKSGAAPSGTKRQTARVNVIHHPASAATYGN